VKIVLFIELYFTPPIYKHSQNNYCKVVYLLGCKWCAHEPLLFINFINGKRLKNKERGERRNASPPPTITTTTTTTTIFKSPILRKKIALQVMYQQLKSSEEKKSEEKKSEEKNEEEADETVTVLPSLQNKCL
jgi:hypothetical protein